MSADSKFEIAEKYPELQKAAESLTDYIGEQATQRPEGPTYEFFANLAPPQRYVTTSYLDYPIVLGAPGALRKARIVSNGSAVNPRNDSKMWHDNGFPVTFFVGDDTATTFGLEKKDAPYPRLADGYLPIAQIEYLHQGTSYTQESFVPVREPYIKYAGLLMKFGTASGAGKVRARLPVANTPDGTTGTKIGRNYVCDASGRGLVWFSAEWKWDAAGNGLTASLSQDSPAYLVVFTDPHYLTPEPVDAKLYAAERERCASAWNAILARGTQVEVPEPIVNDAWRASLLGNYVLLKGDDMNYSANNNYEKLYAAEGGDAVRSIMLFGQLEDGKRTTPPVMDYWRNELTNHQAAFALQLFAHTFWLTHDADYVEQQRPRWNREVQEILNSRDKSTGLLPKERYAGDIPTFVHSLNVNSNCWRGLRDMAAVLKECGKNSEAEPLEKTAAEFRKAIIEATEKSVYRDFKPPFVPMALFGEEKPLENLNKDHISAYYCLMAPYVLGSEVFGPGHEFETDILQTFEQRGGLSMGMVRTHPRNALYIGGHAVNNLYTLRLTQTQLRRDDVDKALVSFYGKLGNAVCPGTFYSGEASGILPNDEFGRPFYLPPNSASNAYLLWMLRYILVQDWDLNDDGKSETLRLMFATPKQWLRDGAKVKIERAPTAFGLVSLNVESRLSDGEVIARWVAPERKPDKTLIKLRMPGGYIVESASAGGNKVPVDQDGVADLTAVSGEQTIKFHVRKK